MEPRQITQFDVDNIPSLRPSNIGDWYCINENNKLEFLPTRTVAYIEHDEIHEDPRKDWDGWLGTMACWHGRYQLGDEQPSESLDEWVTQLVDNVQPGFADWLETRSEQIYEHAGEDLQKSLQASADFVENAVWQAFNRYFIWLPLFLYDHGGITMSTGGFSCPWDSSQVGIIYISRADARKYMGWKRISAKRERQILDTLKSEVDTYDDHLRGDWWMFTVYQQVWNPEEDEWEDVGDCLDSCGGFLGGLGDPYENGIIEHLGSDVELIINTDFDKEIELAA